MTVIPDVLASFSRFSSVRLLIAETAACVAARLAAGGWSWKDAIVAGIVLLLWPLQEWIVHSRVLHRNAGPLAKYHGEHHRRPWRLDLVPTPIYVMFIVPPFVATLWLAGRAGGTAAAVYLLLALHFEWVHVLVHSGYVPRSAWYRRLYRNHMLHHFHDPRRWYGVSM